jgi:CRP-like cAMP-binding protein
MLTVLEKVDLLQKAPIFHEVPTESLARVAAIAQEASFEAHQALFRQNDAADTMFFLVEGEVAILSDGQESRRVGVHEVVGALALLAGKSQPESATASQTTRTLQIDQQEFYDAMAEDFSLTRGILRALVHLLPGRI